MNKDEVKCIIGDLKSTTSSIVQKALSKIRSDIIVNADGIRLFRECRGFECIIPLLRKPNERILDLTLSILGDCCLNEECCISVGSLNIYAHLITILATVAKDSIIGRTCRLIGNLAQQSLNAKHLHRRGAVGALLQVINGKDERISYLTLTMAVRAIRLLWMVMDQRNHMMIAMAVQSVTTLMVTECEKVNLLQSDSDDDSVDDFKTSQGYLMIGILKCLGYFTTYSTKECADQIACDGKGFKCLVQLTKVYESLALKCLMNLCYVASCRLMLVREGFVECLVGILQNKSADEWPEGSCKALAHLSGESVNRMRLRTSGGLPLLLVAARRNALVLHSLMNYIFDDDSLEILINKGLIDMLIEEIKDYLKTMQCGHKDATPAKNDPKRRCKKKNIVCDIRFSNSSRIPDTSDLYRVGRQDKRLVSRESSSESIDEYSGCSGLSECSDDSDTVDKVERMTAYRKWLHNKVPECLEILKDSKLFTFGAERKSTSKTDQPNEMQCDDSSSTFRPEDMVTSPPYKRMCFDLSPESNASGGDLSSPTTAWAEFPWSPGSSRSPASPCSMISESSGSDISGRYSPVCGEGEAETELSVSDGRPIDYLDPVTDMMVTSDLVDNYGRIMTDPTNERNLTSNSCKLACALVLLYMPCFGNSSYTEKAEEISNNATKMMIESDCLNVLLNYIETCEKPLHRASKILRKIFSNRLFVKNLLNSRIVLRLHDVEVNIKHPKDRCEQCYQLAELCVELRHMMMKAAESRFGIGEICFQLLRGTSSMKDTIAITIPHIVKDQRKLRNFLIDHGALHMLFTCIMESRESLELCVIALMKLATNIDIKDPKHLENRYIDKLYSNYNPVLDDVNTEDIITFELEDKSTVQANKVALCQSSEYFNALLMGSFKEAIERKVSLKHVKKLSLECLLKQLLSGLNEPQNNIQVYPMDETLLINLETLLLADKFLLDKLKLSLVSAILQFQLVPESIFEIYSWSLGEGMGFMCVESVAYLLTGSMADAARTQVFKSILDSQYKNQFLDDIKTMIMRQLVK